ncbi:MAG: SH3 domain-containing protein [bacterium]
MIRLIKITGWTHAARENRLKVVADWMRDHGWEMTDFSEEAGSAFFERAAGAPRLGWFDPTRWLPGPVSWRPWELWTAIRADPRLLLPPALLTALGVAVVMVAAAPDLAPPAPASVPQKTGQKVSEKWWVVTSVRLNVREAPTTLSQVVGILYKDQRVLVRAEIDANWVEIELPERGFVARKFVRTKAVGAAEMESP